MPGSWTDLAHQLRIGKTPSCRRAINRILEEMKTRRDNGEYWTPMAAESVFRESVEKERSCHEPKKASILKAETVEHKRSQSSASGPERHAQGWAQDYSGRLALPPRSSRRESLLAGVPQGRRRQARIAEMRPEGVGSEAAFTRRIQVHQDDIGLGFGFAQVFLSASQKRRSSQAR
jgi:hypothetical protein